MFNPTVYNEMLVGSDYTAVHGDELGKFRVLARKQLSEKLAIRLNWGDLKEPDWSLLPEQNSDSRVSPEMDALFAKYVIADEQVHVQFVSGNQYDDIRCVTYLATPGCATYTPAESIELFEHLECKDKSLRGKSNIHSLLKEIDLLKNFPHRYHFSRKALFEKLQLHWEQLRELMTEPMPSGPKRTEASDPWLLERLSEQSLPQYIKRASGGAKKILEAYYELEFPVEYKLTAARKNGSIRNTGSYWSTTCLLCLERKWATGNHIRIMFDGPKYACFEGGKAWAKHTSSELTKFIWQRRQELRRRRVINPKSSLYYWCQDPGICTWYLNDYMSALQYAAENS